MLIDEFEDELPDLRLALAGQTYLGDYAAASLSSAALQFAKDTFVATLVLGTMVSPIWISMLPGSNANPRTPQLVELTGNSNVIVLPQVLSELRGQSDLAIDIDAVRKPSADRTKISERGLRRRHELAGNSASSTTATGNLGPHTPPSDVTNTTRQNSIGSVTLDATGTTLDRPFSSATAAPSAPAGIRVSPNAE